MSVGRDLLGSFTELHASERSWTPAQRRGTEAPSDAVQTAVRVPGQANEPAGRQSRPLLALECHETPHRSSLAKASP